VLPFLLTPQRPWMRGVARGDAVNRVRGQARQFNAAAAERGRIDARRSDDFPAATVTRRRGVAVQVGADPGCSNTSGPSSWSPPNSLSRVQCDHGEVILMGATRAQDARFVFFVAAAPLSCEPRVRGQARSFRAALRRRNAAGATVQPNYRQRRRSGHSGGSAARRTWHCGRPGPGGLACHGQLKTPPGANGL
jgi:hypothetical protein